MDPRCAASVRAAAAGRQISDAKLASLDSTIAAWQRELARQARQEARTTGTNRWLSMTREQQIAEAVAKAMEDVQSKAALKEFRAAQQVLRTAETGERIDQQLKLGAKTRSEAYIRDIQNTANLQQAERNVAIAGMRDLIDAAESKDGAGLVRRAMMSLFDMDNPAMTADIVREVFKNGDGHTGNAGAKAASKVWLDTIEGLRHRFNAAGGDVGKLGYGYLSQAHDQVRVVKAGADVWAAKVLPMLDREQYVKADGSLMADAEVLDMLRAAHETIAQNGDNKTAPGQFKGAGSRANKGSDHRVLHFKDGDAWMAYMDEFGEGSLYDAMLGHIGAMTRDIVLLERYGPNPEQQHRLQADMARREDGQGTWKNREWGNTPDAYWSLITGKAGAPENRMIARVGQDVRNVQTAAKLGGAVLSALTDVGTIGAALHYNRLPYFDMLNGFKDGMVPNVIRQFRKGERQFLQAHAVIGEALTSTMNRWTGDNLTHSLTGRVAGSVMKLSLMNAWTDGLRGAFQATMMGNFARKLGKAWGELDEWDRYLMERKGLSEADWSIITKAQPIMHNGRSYLTHDAIAAVDGGKQAAGKWLAFTSDEAQFAILNPDLATRAVVTGGGMPAGTLRGEAMRSMMQFKSFPTAMFTRHWQRIFETPQGMEGAPAGFGAETQAGATVNRIAVMAGMNVTLMMLGALVLQNKALVQGKDPYDMTEGKFWTRALTQGGGMGYLGDFIFKDPTEQRSNTFEQAIGTAFGPAAGAAAGLVGDLGLVNAWEAAKGKDTKAAAETIRWLNGQLPYANLWQTRAVWEHWFLHNAQEAVNPGYLSRMQQRAQRDWGQGYWWALGEFTPDRMPDMSGAFGQ